MLDTSPHTATAMASFAAMKNLAVWYAHLDIEIALEGARTAAASPRRSSEPSKALAKARTKDSMTAFSKLTHLVDGQARIRAEPPLIVPIDDLVRGPAREEMFDELRELLRRYRETLEYERRVLIEQFQLVDFARKVVGRGQRRHARLDRAAARPRRQGSAVSADEGGGGVGARGVPRTRASSRTTASASSSVSV